MRKIWWLPVVSIAACVAQALVAADSRDSVTRKGTSAGRSRLLIYSRNKSAETEEEQLEETPRSTGGRTLRRATEQEAAPVRRPTGDTGTISPKSSVAKPGVSKASPDKTELEKVAVKSDAKSATRPATAAKSTKVDFVDSDAARTDTDEISDDEIRQMFEDETAAPKTAVKRPAVRTAEVPSEATDEEQTGLSEVEPLDPDARRAARYRELLGASAATGEKSPKSAEKAPVRSNQKIVPVSAEPANTNDLEINPFEPSERPTKVVNASFEEEHGMTGARRVRQASSTVATKPTATTPTAPKSTPAKPAVIAKGADGVKTVDISESTTAKPEQKSTTPRGQQEAVISKTSFADSGSNQSPQVDVKWEVRGEVTLGQECQCVLIVHNSGKVAARDIIVEANFPESVQLVDAKPFPKEASQKLEWQFGTMAAGEKKIIELMMVPTKRGELETSARVRFTGTAATSFQVSEPLLTATVKMPEEIHLGESASAVLTVSNPGTGTAHNVVVETALPAGLASTSGKDIVTELGPLGAGETRTVRFSVIATAGGDHTLKVMARSSTADLQHTASAKVSVLAPSLALKATGPSLRYVNRAAKYQLTVTNNSNAPSDNVRVMQTVDKAFDYVKADHGGQWDSQRRVVSWYLGHLDARQTATLELELMPRDTGEFQQNFKVVGDAGAQATADVMTRVDAAASLVMEVRDGDDPVEVGAETPFEIRVRNDGSKSAHKVAISLELPPDVEMVNVDGPTQHLFESGMLIFKPLAELAAGDTATFLVYIKGTASGTTKLRARLTSESIQKPLIVEEATQFYQE